MRLFVCLSCIGVFSIFLNDAHLPYTAFKVRSCIYCFVCSMIGVVVVATTVNFNVLQT
uniref:Hypothetical secreted peptide n=1 Tax=Glossina morsitans morsitans TaxID=37546 RepID=D3TSJ7_GLOMM